jgi:hypothetical protein
MTARISVGIAGALIALIASLMAFAGTPGAVATQGDPVVAGSQNSATSTTLVYDETVSGTGCILVPHSGLTGCGSNGVEGYGAASGVYGAGVNGNGVFGESAANAASGVYGQNDSTGYGVAGRAVNGTGVLADSANGTALKVTGRSKFSTAGTAVIASGSKSVTVTLAGVSASDFVLATVQGKGAFYVKNASAGSGQFTIYINKAPTAPATVTVAYFVISAS